jgi:rhodanese-related sulfurtransferase
MKLSIRIIETLLMICIFVTPFSSLAIDVKPSVTKKEVVFKKQTPANKYLTARETYALVKAHGEDILFIDVRTPAEIEFVGWTSLVDAVIPYLNNDFSAWNPKKHRYKKVMNNQFLAIFENLVASKKFNKNTMIIFMCRSGTRSAKATTLASKLGYINAYTVIDGFEGDKAKKGGQKGARVINGWKNSGAPWNYKPNGEKILTGILK